MAPRPLVQTSEWGRRTWSRHGAKIVVRFYDKPGCLEECDLGHFWYCIWIGKCQRSCIYSTKPRRINRDYYAPTWIMMLPHILHHLNTKSHSTICMHTVPSNKKHIPLSEVFLLQLSHHCKENRNPPRCTRTRVIVAWSGSWSNNENAHQSSLCRSEVVSCVECRGRRDIVADFTMLISSGTLWQAAHCKW
jgi:hypothetical protein